MERGFTTVTGNLLSGLTRKSKVKTLEPSRSSPDSQRRRASRFANSEKGQLQGLGAGSPRRASRFASPDKGGGLVEPTPETQAVPGSVSCTIRSLLVTTSTNSRNEKRAPLGIGNPQGFSLLEPSSPLSPGGTSGGWDSPKKSTSKGPKQAKEYCNATKHNPHSRRKLSEEREEVRNSAKHCPNSLRKKSLERDPFAGSRSSIPSSSPRSLRKLSVEEVRNGTKHSPQSRRKMSEEPNFLGKVLVSNLVNKEEREDPSNVDTNKQQSPPIQRKMSAVVAVLSQPVNTGGKLGAVIEERDPIDVDLKEVPDPKTKRSSSVPELRADEVRNILPIPSSFPCDMMDKLVEAPSTAEVPGLCSSQSFQSSLRSRASPASQERLSLKVSFNEVTHSRELTPREQEKDESFLELSKSWWESFGCRSISSDDFGVTFTILYQLLIPGASVHPKSQITEAFASYCPGHPNVEGTLDTFTEILWDMSSTWRVVHTTDEYLQHLEGARKDFEQSEEIKKLRSKGSPKASTPKASTPKALTPKAAVAQPQETEPALSGCIKCDAPSSGRFCCQCGASQTQESEPEPQRQSHEDEEQGNILTKEISALISCSSTDATSVQESIDQPSQPAAGRVQPPKKLKMKKKAKVRKLCPPKLSQCIRDHGSRESNDISPNSATMSPTSATMSPTNGSKLGPIVPKSETDAVSGHTDSFSSCSSPTDSSVPNSPVPQTKDPPAEVRSASPDLSLTPKASQASTPKARSRWKQVQQQVTAHAFVSQMGISLSPTKEKPDPTQGTFKCNPGSDRYFYIEGCIEHSITPALEVFYIFNDTPDQHVMHFLDISNKQLDSIKPFEKIFEKNTLLESINLKDNCLKGPEICRLAQILRNHSRLYCLNLAGNFILANFAVSVGENIFGLVSTNTSILQCDLAGLRLDPANRKAIAEQLQKNTAKKSITLEIFQSMYDLFGRADHGKSGNVDIDELLTLLVEKGYVPSETAHRRSPSGLRSAMKSSMLKKMWTYDSNQDGQLTFPEMMNVFYPSLKTVALKEQLDLLQEESTLHNTTTVHTALQTAKA